MPTATPATGQAGALAQQQQQRLIRPRTERHADAHLLRSLLDVVAEHAVNAEHRQHERDTREEQQQQQRESAFGQ